MTPRHTIAAPVTATGIALHAGVAVTMTLAPAASGAGIVFRRADLERDIPALYDRVGETRLGTVITENGAGVGVIEHLMAAIAGAGVDDLLVVLDGPEPPILDGDAASYLALIHRAGLAAQSVARQAIAVRREVRVTEGDAHAALAPADDYSLGFEIDFPAPIGRQTFEIGLTPESFARDIAPARTFGFMADLEKLNTMGLARGASLENTLAIDGGAVRNAGLMRFPDEFVRHKILDAIGDMALAGAPLRARFHGHRSGHGLNNRLLRALFADPDNYALVTA